MVLGALQKCHYPCIVFKNIIVMKKTTVIEGKCHDRVLNGGFVFSRLIFGYILMTSNMLETLVAPFKKRGRSQSNSNGPCNYRSKMVHLLKSAASKTFWLAKFYKLITIRTMENSKKEKMIFSQLIKIIYKEAEENPVQIELLDVKKGGDSTNLKNALELPARTGAERIIKKQSLILEMSNNRVFCSKTMKDYQITFHDIYKTSSFINQCERILNQHKDFVDFLKKLYFEIIAIEEQKLDDFNNQGILNCLLSKKRPYLFYRHDITKNWGKLKDLSLEQQNIVSDIKREQYGKDIFTLAKELGNDNNTTLRENKKQCENEIKYIKSDIRLNYSLLNSTKYQSDEKRNKAIIECYEYQPYKMNKSLYVKNKGMGKFMLNELCKWYNDKYSAEINETRRLEKLEQKKLKYSERCSTTTLNRKLKIQEEGKIIIDLISKNVSLREIARRLNTSLATVQRRLKKLNSIL